MALVRILVDGCSLLDQWLELAPGKPRHSVVARDELIHALTQFHDACGVPISVYLNEVHAPPDAEQLLSTPEVEVHFPRPGSKADHLIERAAYRFRSTGNVQVITDNQAIRNTVSGCGAAVLNCHEFIGMVKDCLASLEHDIDCLNQREHQRFNAQH